VPREAEVLWRFSPGAILKKDVGSESFRLQSGLGSHFNARFISNEEWKIEPDPDGEAQWNSGVVSDRVIVPSPAIRGTSFGTDLAIAAVFSTGELGDYDGSNLQWQSSEEWGMSLGLIPGTKLRVSRKGNELHVMSVDDEVEVVRLDAVDDASNALEQENQAYLAMSERYGEPIKFNVERRVKVSIAVVLAALFQVLIIVFVWIWLTTHWVATLGLSSICWIGLCLFLQFSFLA
jgi:hypothetical protein